jgi:hypothetical protein
MCAFLLSVYDKQFSQYGRKKTFRTYIYIYICMYVGMHVCIYVCVCVCMYVSV